MWDPGLRSVITPANLGVMTPTDDQSNASQRAGIKRVTAKGDATCDRCYAEILDGSYPGVVQPAAPIPWVAGTVLCSECADRMEEKYGR